MQHIVESVIADSHPSLSGHFPGNPVVPGVVILEQVVQALHAWQPDARVSGMPNVKFLSPLLPGQPFTIELHREASAQKVRFTCREGEKCLAQGLLTLMADGV